MSTGPRSQRLLAYSFTAAGASPAFVCPPNTVTLVKDVTFWCANQTPTVVYFVVRDAAGSVSVVPAYEELSYAKALNWQGWLVLHPGDSVHAESAGASVTVWLSGAVLLGPPPFAPAELAVPPVFPPVLGTTPALETASSRVQAPRPGPKRPRQDR